MPDPPTRQLAAVLFTDVVDYTGLVRDDEASAAAARARVRELVEKAVQDLGGRLLQYYGDGSLSVFDSAVHAVEAAVQIQRALQEPPVVQARAGIHLGEIAYDEQGAFGDAVNLSARIQGRAAPGSVLVSDAVVAAIRSSRRFPTVLLGEVQLKGADRPMSLHAVGAEGISVPRSFADSVVESTGERTGTRRLTDQVRGRKIAEWLVAYLGGAWLLLQLVDIVGDQFGWPVRLQQSITIALAFGFLIAVVIAWNHGEKGRQRVTGAELLSVGLILAVGGSVLAMRGGAAPAAPNNLPVVTSSSIAVLPFRDLSPEGDQQYLGDGIAEEILNVLTLTSGLQVAARSLAFQFRESDIVTAAAGLNVANVLEGTVTREGDRTHVTSQLVAAVDGFTVWAGEYDRIAESVIGVQDEIARAVAEALKTELQPSALPSIATVTRAPDAYFEYLRGRFAWNTRTVEGLFGAVEHFERAIELDSSYAAAFSGLADAWASLPTYARPEDVMEAYPNAEFAALRALELDSTLAEARTSLALVKLAHRLDWDGAEADFQTVLASTPTYAPANQWYSVLLSLRGSTEEAIRLAREAQELDPSLPIMNQNLGDALKRSRDFEGALEQYRHTLSLDSTFAPAWFQMADAQVAIGAYDQAADAYVRWAALTNREPGVARLLATLAQTRMETGQSADLPEGLMAELESEPGFVASLLLRAGQYDLAVRWLQRALVVNDRFPILLEAKTNPTFDPLRGDPRFQEMLRQTGLEPTGRP